MERNPGATSSSVPDEEKRGSKTILKKNTVSRAPHIIAIETSSSSVLSRAVSTMTNLFYSLRPHQWSKNLLVFAALIFAGQMFHVIPLLRSIAAFFIFCFSAGAVYIWNDCWDIEEDRLHPTKRYRPIASGKISSASAQYFAAGIVILCLISSYVLSFSLMVILFIYLGLNLLYSFKLKHIIILDILIVAIGYVLRAVAGAYVIQVEISSWLLICTFFLALFLVVGKRRAELQQLGESSSEHRPILQEYNPHILDQMISVVTAATVIGYALYTLDSQTVEKFGTGNLIYTVPFVVYGIFRYFYLIYKKELGGNPESILIKDVHILVNVLLWIVTILLIIYLR